MIRRRAVLGLASAGALLVVACSPTLATPSSHSADPSSPSAPAGRSPLAAVPEASATPGPTASAAPGEHHHGGHDHGGHDHGAAPPATASAKPAAPASPAKGTAALYACPMHPEVRSNAPGLCPKCNMKLEKQP